jgi:hypothetical protein
MKSAHLALTLALVSLALSTFTGCATTRIDVRTSKGVRVTARFPKDMDATNLKIVFDPVAQVYTFTASKLRTDASGVVREQMAGVQAVADAAVSVAPFTP